MRGLRPSFRVFSPMSPLQPRAPNPRRRMRDPRSFGALQRSAGGYAASQGLGAGVSKHEAMRRAKARLAAYPKPAHPFYWAPFLVTGDPRPMALPRPASKVQSR